MKSLIVSATFAILALFGLALVLTWRSQDQRRLDDARKSNCIAIEQLKQIQRTALLEEIRQARLYLHNNSDRIPGINDALIEESIRRDENTLRELAPQEC